MSSIDICNLALAHIGDESNVTSIAPPDGSVQAAHCSRFYPIALSQILERHAWSFATTRISLALTGTAPSEWDYQYAYPTNCVKVLKILPYEGTSDDITEEFQVESLADGTRVIMTNTELATCRYILNVTDTSKFTPAFTVAFSWLLASYLAGPITKDLAKKESTYKVFLIELGTAAKLDANSGNRDPRVHFTPSSIQARR